MTIAATESLDYLLKLAEEKSSDKRRELLEQISEIFLGESSAVSERENELMGEIMNRLVHDMEMVVRRRLSERLADIDNAPRELVLSLANDDIEVAAPILSRSGVLEDADLIEIVRHRSQEHLMAVARRQAVSEEVSDAIVDNGDGDAIETLLNNHSALISRRAMSYLAAESKRLDRLQRPLLTRPELPSSLAYEMFDWVSQALKQHILQSYELDEETLNEVIQESKRIALDADAEGPAPGTEAEKLVNRLEAAGQLTEYFLVQTLRDGRIDVFMTALARKCGTDVRTARRIVLDHGESGLAIACKAGGFDRSTFASLLMLRHKADKSDRVMMATSVDRMLSVYNTIAPHHAKRVLRFWSLRHRDASEAAAASAA